MILAIESVDKASFAKQWQSDYKNTFKEEVINPEKLEGLAIQLLAHELKNNEAVYSRFFMALSRLEVNISEENRRKWINLLITLALNKPEYASRLLDRRYSFRWFSNQAKAYLEIGDIKKILLGSLTGKEDNRRYVDDQMSLVFSRRFFWLLSPDAMKFSGEDLIDLLNGGQSDSLSRAVSSDSRYLKKILHALNDKAQKGDSESVLKILTHLHSYHLSVFNGLNGEYKEFKEQFKETIAFDFPETGELTGYKPRAMTAKKPRRETPSAKAPLALGPEEFNGQVSSLIKGGTPIASLPLNGLPEDLDDGASDDGLSNEVHSSDEAEDDHLEYVPVIEAHQSPLRRGIPSAPSYLGGISGGINVIQTGTSLISQSSSSMLEPVLERDDNNLDGRRDLQGVLPTVPNQLHGSVSSARPPLPFLASISSARKESLSTSSVPSVELGQDVGPKKVNNANLLLDIVMGRDAFFRKSDLNTAAIKQILSTFFEQNGIELVTGAWANAEKSSGFIKELFTIRNRVAAVAFIEGNLRKQNKSVVVAPESDDDDNWDDPKAKIIDKWYEDLVDELSKLEHFKTWGEAKSIKPPSITQALSEAMSKRREVMANPRQ